jgi:hypothetical protein
MISATVKELKTELSSRPPKELVELCLSLAKFKKENKELLTYLLYEAENEEAFIAGVKNEIDQLFTEVNRESIYLAKKTIRKILRITKKYIRYSKKPETDISLRIHFCSRMWAMRSFILRSGAMEKLYQRELESIQKTIGTLHEDLQYDFIRELEKLSPVK